MKKNKNVQTARFRLRFRLLPTLAFIGLLVLFLGLANWQWGRAEEKRQWLQMAEKNGQEKIMSLSGLSGMDLDTIRYKKIILTGHYDSGHQFLLDNQINAGKAGFFVLTPFLVAGEDHAVLINRGWLPLNTKDRSILPDLSVTDQEVKITGRINKFPSVGIKLKGAETPTDTWPSIIQVFDESRVSRKLARPVMFFQVELDENLPNGFKRDWQISRMMSPEQHLGYAMQWLALALTVTGLFVWHSVKINH